MTLFKTIRSCVFDPEFYARMHDRSWSEGAKYYAVVAFIIVFILMAPVWAVLLNARPEIIDTATALYPDTLELTLAHGELHTNQPEPFAIPNTFTKSLPANLAVFDTRNDVFTPSALRDAHTLVLFKRTFAITENSDSASLPSSGEQRIFSYGTTTGTTTLTKSDIVSFASKIKPYVRPVAIFGGAILFVLAVILGGFGMLVFHLLYIFFPALLVFAYFKLRKRNESYRTAYVSALFASIPVTILAAFFGLFIGLPLFTYTAILLIIVIVNDSQSHREISASTH